MRHHSEARGIGRSRCPLVWSGLAVALLTTILMSGGCKTSASGVRPAEAYTAPEWGEQNIQSLAFLGVGSSVGDPAARREAQYVVEEQLKGGQDRFLLLGFQEAQRRAESAGARDLFDKVVRVWRDNRLADRLLVQELGKAIGVDGLIFASLLDWEQHRVDWASEGTSSTQVTLGLTIFSAKTGEEVWQAEKVHRKETLQYTYGQSGTGVYTDDSGASRAERPTSLTPDPPRPEIVAQEAMQALIAAFPPRKGG